MSTDKSEREAFEAEIRKDCGDLSTFGSGKDLHYRNSAVNNAWIGWKARAAQPSQPATVVPVARDLHDRIMNAPIPMAPKIPADAGVMMAYKLGHRDARHAAAELALAHPSAPAESGWQPIATAPKGHCVLLFSERSKGISIGDWGDYDRYNQPRFTLWQPLPAAPSAAQPGGEDSGDAS